MTEFAPTGIARLDELLGGGLPREYLYLILSTPGSDAVLFTLQFIAQGLKVGEKCVLLVTHTSPTHIRTRLEKLGIDVAQQEREGDLTIIDGFSWRMGASGDEKFSIENPCSLTEAYRVIRSAISAEGNTRFAITQDTFEETAGTLQALKMYESLSGLCTKTKTTMLINDIKGSLTPTERRKMLTFVNGLIEMELDEGKGKCPFRRMRLTEIPEVEQPQCWLYYDVEDWQITLVDKK